METPPSQPLVYQDIPNIDDLVLFGINQATKHHEVWVNSGWKITLGNVNSWPELFIAFLTCDHPVPGSTRVELLKSFTADAAHMIKNRNTKEVMAPKYYNPIEMCEILNEKLRLYAKYALPGVTIPLENSFGLRFKADEDLPEKVTALQTKIDDQPPPLLVNNLSINEIMIKKNVLENQEEQTQEKQRKSISYPHKH